MVILPHGVLETGLLMTRVCFPEYLLGKELATGMKQERQHDIDKTDSCNMFTELNLDNYQSTVPHTWYCYKT